MMIYPSNKVNYYLEVVSIGNAPLFKIGPEPSSSHTIGPMKGGLAVTCC